MMDDIQMMMMGFNFYKVVDIETTRQLLVDSVQEYLSAINSNEEIRPHLHQRLWVRGFKRRIWSCLKNLSFSIDKKDNK